MGTITTKPRTVVPMRIEYSSWSARVIWAECYEEDQRSWSVLIPAHIAVELHLTDQPSRSDPYMLATSLSRQDAERFVEAFGPMIARYREPDREP